MASVHQIWGLRCPLAVFLFSRAVPLHLCLGFLTWPENGPAARGETPAARRPEARSGPAYVTHATSHWPKPLVGGPDSGGAGGGEGGAGRRGGTRTQPSVGAAAENPRPRFISKHLMRTGF